MGLIDQHPSGRVALKASVLKKLAQVRKGVSCLITDPFIVAATGIGLAQVADLAAAGVNNQGVGQGMGFFLPLYSTNILRLSATGRPQ